MSRILEAFFWWAVCSGVIAILLRLIDGHWPDKPSVALALASAALFQAYLKDPEQ